MLAAIVGGGGGASNRGAAPESEFLINSPSLA